MDLRLVAEGLTVKRGGLTALEDVSFRAAEGDIIAVIGPNGAGKTSLLDAVLGFLPLASGRVLVEGRALRTFAERARVFSMMPDDAEPPAEVRVRTLLAASNRALDPELLEHLGLGPLLDARAGELSRGERRRVLLYSALATVRPVIVLDEPLGAFDPLQVREVAELIRRRARGGTTFLVSVHQLADAEKIASHVLLLDRGRAVAFGPLDGLRAAIGDPTASLETIFLRTLEARRAHARA